MTHPVEYGCPSLHGDALEDSDAGVDDIVEAGYAVVGPLPFFQAYGYVGVAAVAPAGSGRGVVRVARHHLPTFRHDLIWRGTKNLTHLTCLEEQTLSDKVLLFDVFQKMTLFGAESICWFVIYDSFLLQIWVERFDEAH